MNYFQAALSLVIHKTGSVSDWDVDDLIERYRIKQATTVNKRLFLQVLSEATQHYEDKVRCLFICAEGACSQKSLVATTEDSLHRLSEKLGCDVETTGCHWRCQDAPVMMLKTGQATIRFDFCGSELAVKNMYDDVTNILLRNPTSNR
jgi:hypothetical protein